MKPWLKNLKWAVFVGSLAVIFVVVPWRNDHRISNERMKRISDLETERKELKSKLRKLENRSDSAAERSSAATDQLAALRKEAQAQRELAEVNAMDAEMMRKKIAEQEKAAQQKGHNPLVFLEAPARSKPDWKFMGFSSPEETLESMMWAMRQGDFDIAMQARLEGHREAAALTRDERESSRQSFLAAGAAAREYKLIWKNQVLPQLVYLKVQVDGWGERPQVMGFQHTGTSWKVVGESFEVDK